MARVHGIQEFTYDKFILDNGAVFFGFTDFDDPGTLMGATRDGVTVSIEPEIREMMVDGAHGPVKKSKRIIGSIAKITATFIEHTTANFIKSITGADSTDFEADWDAVTRALKFSGIDFVDNIAVVGEVSGDTDPFAVILKNVINNGNFELSLVDKDEGGLTVEFTAHSLPADIASGNDTEPFSIVWPKTDVYLFDSEGVSLLDSDGVTLITQQ